MNTIVCVDISSIREKNLLLIATLNQDMFICRFFADQPAASDVTVHPHCKPSHKSGKRVVLLYLQLVTEISTNTPKTATIYSVLHTVYIGNFRQIFSKRSGSFEKNYSTCRKSKPPACVPISSLHHTSSVYFSLCRALLSYNDNCWR